MGRPFGLWAVDGSIPVGPLWRNVTVVIGSIT